MHHFLLFASLYENKHNKYMRTTVTLSREAADLVDRYSGAQGVSKSRAVSDLILLADPSRSRTRLVNGILVFEAPDNAEKFDLEDLERLQDEDF